MICHFYVKKRKSKTPQIGRYSSMNPLRSSLSIENHCTAKIRVKLLSNNQLILFSLDFPAHTKRILAHTHGKKRMLKWSSSKPSNQGTKRKTLPDNPLKKDEFLFLDRNDVLAARNPLTIVLEILGFGNLKFIH